MRSHLFNVVVTFSNFPSTSGSDVNVDSYIITVMPKPVSHPIHNQVFSIPWNVTLNNNVEYTVSITAVNCAGRSRAYKLNFENSKHVTL